ncbi:uncharacterized protein LOC135348075 isoform X3 [Halichondria panicea]|uniref:uncharacterized protein LOC135348075 isoform X3 n=1 Tax=Halichondria panicea TaxID=6063 RepID=UPI00312BC5CA
MCQQLGYDVEYSSIKVHWDKNGIDPWFTKVMCDSKKTNILRCNTNPPNPNELGCSKLYLHCGPDESWNKVPNEGYIGQVLLLHPENTAPGYQVSFGLVLIYMHDTWGVIAQNKTQPFTRNAADSVCRQMGYTEANPNHITTAKNSNTSYPHANLYHNAWLTSNNTRDCIDSSEPCFSCCFTKPTHQCSVNTCLFEDGIVLQCFFDLNKEDLGHYSEGDKELCQISDYRKPNSCAGEVNPSLGDLCLDRDKSLQGVPLLLVYSRGPDLRAKWGTICDDQVDRTTLTTMCQQLGYDNGKYQEVWGYSDVDPWFSEVTCGSQIT